MIIRVFRSVLCFRHFGFVATFVVLFLLTACGGPDGGAGSNSAPQQAESASPASAGAIDPCILVTANEAEQVLGAPTGQAERPPEANNPLLSTCRYTAPRGQGVVVLVVMVHNREVGKRGFQTAKEQPFDIQAVKGVGDDAFWIGSPLNTVMFSRTTCTLISAGTSNYIRPGRLWRELWSACPSDRKTSGFSGFLPIKHELLPVNYNSCQS